MSVIAPTGAGKTTFVGGLLNHCRRYALVLDPKGGDTTLEGLGYERLSSCPGYRKMARLVGDNDDAQRPSRYLCGPRIETKADKPRLITALRDFLELAYDMGDWTVYADELQLLTDPRFMNLRAQVDDILVSARYKGLSFVSSYQAPSWVTPAASKMSTWVAVSYTRDIDVVNRLAEILGRPKPEIRGALEGLEEYTWLLVGRNPREPVRVTLPDYLAPAVRQ
jgi:hypothetical protein